ncbi:class I SAM-dependent methyltransferase [Streptomyces sp. NPDC006739]|uniref:class I SAM-dependent methyltransferase n=1 Tax=Streptomyces sp. NPDC006739 TaxID=3364763 RepID=UPI00369F3761
MLIHHQLTVNGSSTTRVLIDPDAGQGSTVWPSVGEYPIYDEVLYDTLSSDALRNERFRAALRKLAPGRVALDIGTGQYLNWARESIRSGAEHAVAMEVMDETFRAAEHNLRAWNLDHSITLLHGNSSELTIEPQADLCVAEIIGSIAGAEGAAAIFSDARRRLMTDDGVVIPDRCTTQAAGVCLRKVLDRHKIAFSPSAVPHLTKIFAWNQGFFDVRLRIKEPDPRGVITTSAPIEELHFNGDLRTEQEQRVELEVDRAGHVDGVLLWLQLFHLPSCPPLDALAHHTSWASVYIPLFPSEIPVERGDRLALTVVTQTSDDGIHPDYHVTGALSTANGRYIGEHISAHHGHTFRSHPVYRTLFP